MTAQIIQLERPPRGQRCLRSGLVFPVLYRVRGFYYDQDNNKLFASDTPVTTTYTLSKDDNHRIAEPCFEAVKALNAPDDASGWLIVRHHTTESRARGYLDAIMDFKDEGPFERVNQSIFRHESNWYTLAHRKPLPDKEGSVVMYITQLPFTSGFAEGIMGDHWTIVTSDEEITEDIDRFYDQDE